MKLVESILTKNPCYTAGRKITVKGLMLHSVGCNQPKASLIDDYIHFYNFERIQAKTGLTPHQQLWLGRQIFIERTLNGIMPPLFIENFLFSPYLMIAIATGLW